MCSEKPARDKRVAVWFKETPVQAHSMQADKQRSAFASMRKDSQKVEKLAAQTRLAKASLRAGSRPYPVQQHQQQSVRRGNKENVIDDAGLAYSSPSRRTGGGFGFLDANAYRYAGALPN